jgi:acylphosphatase
MLQRKRYLVSGRVQGVGYRYFTLDAAERWGVRGYVRNLGSGDVEVHAEAEESRLRGFKQELQRGPRGARVSRLIEEDLAVSEPYSSFAIRG